MKLFNLLFILGAAYFTVVHAKEESDATQPTCACTREYEPICGSDGVTYSNRCLYKCERDQREKDGESPLTIRCEGPCDKCRTPCVCTKEYRPICGSDGVTYSNPCLFKCENDQREKDGKSALTIRCEGPCEKCKTTCACTREYKPVCGSDDVTYSNRCLFKCEKKRRAEEGEPDITVRCQNTCDKCPCICNLMYAPVCGTDGVTYGNECSLNCKNKERRSQGKPEIDIRCRNECDKCQIEDVCPLNYLPVCGDDGVTYGNKCQFDAENRRRVREGEPQVGLRCQGECDKCSVAEGCSLHYLPVCGDDGVTYGNKCQFDAENRRREREGEPQVGLRCENECDKCPIEDVCPLNYLPVCGSDGVTYSNQCYFDAENRRRESEGQQPITVICEKQCSECPEPVPYSENSD